MARNTQLIELDLRSGITTNDSLYAIGPKLWRATNSVWDYRYPRTVGAGTAIMEPRMHRMPLTFPMAAANNLHVYTTAASFRDLGYTGNTGIATISYGVLAFGVSSAAGGYYSAWRAFGSGAGELTFHASATRAAPSGGIGPKSLGCSVRWENPGVDPDPGTALAAGIGVTVFGHPEVGQIYYLLDNATSIRSLNADTTGYPTSATAMAIHLDRLWIATAGYTTGTGLVYYTDPLNLNSVRSTSIVQVRGDPTALAPGQFGAIDASGVPHLVIGTLDGVYVLDGDPQLGGGLQADLRRLSSTIGIVNSHAICTTQYGVFFLGTDGDLWLIPPGCQTMTPVGGSIRDQLGKNLLTGAIDIDYASPSALLWFDPYLIIVPGGETAKMMLAEPGADGLKFWGPVVCDSVASAGRVAVVGMPTFDYKHHNSAGVYGAVVHSLDVIPPVTNPSIQARPETFHVRTTTANSARTASLQTGLINVPGHRVQAARVILETLRVPQISAADVVWTVTATDERGNVATGVRTPEAVPTAGTYSQSVTQTQHFAFPPPLTASRGISITISASAEADLALQRAFVEVHTSAGQF